LALKHQKQGWESKYELPLQYTSVAVKRYGVVVDGGKHVEVVSMGLSVGVVDMEQLGRGPYRGQLVKGLVQGQYHKAFGRMADAWDAYTKLHQKLRDVTISQPLY
jgi:hypothetical protein